jgi:hypothetical protein
LECFSPNFLFIACFLSSENQIEEKEAFYCEKEKHCKKFQFNSAKECKGGISRRLEYKYLSKKYKRLGFLFQLLLSLLRKKIVNFCTAEMKCILIDCKFPNYITKASLRLYLNLIYNFEILKYGYLLAFCHNVKYYYNY